MLTGASLVLGLLCFEMLRLSLDCPSDFETTGVEHRKEFIFTLERVPIYTFVAMVLPS